MGQYLEAQTIFLCTSLFGAVLTAFAWAAGRWMRTYDGFNDWAIGQGAYATAVLFTLLTNMTGNRGWVVAANFCYLLFALFLLRSTWKFLDRPLPPWGRTPVIVTVVLAAALPTMLLERTLRVTAISLMYAGGWIACISLAVQARRRPGERALWDWMSAWWGAMAAVVLLRIPLLGGASPGGLLDPGWVSNFNNFAYVAGGMVNLALTLGYLALTQQRTARNLRESMGELAGLRRTLDEHAIFATADARGLLREVNDQFCRLTGYARGELLGRSLDLLRTDRHPEEFHAEKNRAIAAGRTWHGDECLRTRDGRHIWVASTLVPVTTAEGRTDGHALLWTDISARKSAEQEIAQQHERLQRSFAIGRMAWLELDPASSRLQVQAAGEIAPLRNAPREADLSHWLAQVEASDRRVVSFGLAAIQHGEKSHLDVTFRLADPATGGWHWVRVIAQRDGRLINGILLDVHATKTAADNRRDMEVQLLHSQKLANLGQFAGGIAHDFNNLLQGIVGNIQLAMLEENLPAPALASLEVAQRGCMRASQLIERLLRFAKGNRVLELKRMSLEQLVNDAAPLIEAAIPRNIELVRECRPGPVVMGDEVKLLQVIMNLCVNAGHAIGGSPGQITLRTGESGGQACLWVSDTGCGMTEEVMAHLFEPFFSTRHSGKGTGLGLAVAKGIVAEHSGEIEVQSKPGAGTTFTLRIPAADSSPATAEARPAAGAKGDVLLIDDDQEVLVTLTRSLQAIGHRVHSFGSTSDARAVLLNRQIEIHWVLCDFTMPDADGVEFLEEARRLRPDVRLGLMSGDLSNAQPKLWRVPGVVTFPKPVEISHLSAVL